MAEWIIERLGAAHDRAGFSCGHSSLDIFLRKLAGQYEKRRLGRTFVAMQPGATKVASYYTLAAGSFAVDCLPAADRKKLPQHPIPTVHIGRLAVDQEFRGKGLGETLLFHALRAALDLSEKLGAFAVDVWSIDKQASAFYQKYGFIPLANDPLHRYLPMKTIADLFAS